ncbi:hypothetical protein A1F99_115070, partial [Pyrenophora tritici-repentis]
MAMSKGYRGGKSARLAGRKARSGTSQAIAALQRQVESLTSGKKKKAEVRGYPAAPFAYAGLEESQYSYLAVPVTLALPPQDPKVAPYISDGYQMSRFATLTGVTVAFSVTSMCAFQVSAVLYAVPPGGNPCPVEHGAGGIPINFPLGLKTSEQNRLMSLDETGFLDGRDGPYELAARRGPADDKGQVPCDFSLASGDGSVYECRLAQGSGAPIGKVDFSV